MDLEALSFDAFYTGIEALLGTAVEDPHAADILRWHCEYAGEGGGESAPEGFVAEVQGKERVVRIGAEELLVAEEQ